jgi:hypothetical protein
MCPNDNAQMQTLDRNGVQFDMCPTCRGVWLDRGELEKLMSAGRSADAEYDRQPAPPPQPRPPAPGYVQHGYGERGEHGYGERGEHGYGERGEHGHYGHRRKRFDLFDIFD